ncbi:zinc finger CCCH domain-containing protein 3-like [Vipera latastei]
MASQGRRRRLEARMEPEQERLRRQIRLLQGLINEHKNAHGNAPVPPPPASLSRWRNPKLPAFHSQTAFSASYGQQPSRDFSAGQANATTWRKKYSLVNTAPRPALSSATGFSPSASWPSQSHASREAPEPQLMLSEATAVSSAKAGAGLPAGFVAGDSAGSGCQAGFSGSRKASRGKLPAAPWPLNAGWSQSKETSASALSPLARCKSPAAGGNHRPAAVQKKPLGRSELAASLGRTISESAIALKSEPRQPLASPEQGSGSLPTWKKPALQPSHLCGSHRQTSPAWTVKLSPAGSGDPSAGCAPSGEETSSSTGGSPPPNKPAVFLVQKSSSVPASVRSSRFKRANYTWVANPSKLPRSVRRWAAASRASESTPKLALYAPATSPKSQSRGANLDLGAKPKKPSPHSKLAASSSQYKWKAASAKPAPPPTSASVFTWKRKEGAGPGDGPSTSFQALRRVPLGPGHLAQGSPRAFLGTSGFLNYKLRSWPKTVKRKGSASSPTLLLKSRYCLRKRHAVRGRSSPTARRTGTKGLVQIGKHRLRRLPASRAPASPKEGSELGYKSPVGEGLFGLASFSPPAFYRAGGREEARPCPELDGAGVK